MELINLQKKTKNFRWIAFVIISCAVLICYYPTLFHPPRADQITYLAETSGKLNFGDLLTSTYDYNRHRLFAPGDETLFRPLLYAILALENLLFGHSHWAWQLTGIGAHLLLVWVLLRIFFRWTGGWVAFAGVWLFALSITNYELVAWPHLTSYIVMMILIVLTIEQCALCFEEHDIGWPRLARIVFYLTTACFIYETANLYTLWVMFVLLIIFPKQWQKSLLLFIPVFLYAGLSFYNYVYVNHLVLSGTNFKVAPIPYLIAIIELTSWWFYAGLFNGIYNYILAVRIIFSPEEVMVFKPLDLHNLQVLGALAMLTVFLGLAWIDRKQLLKRIQIPIMLFGMVFLYVAVIVLGRKSATGGLLEVVRINSYYLYMFWTFVIIGVYAFIAQKQFLGLRRWLLVAFIILCFVSGIGQGKKVYDLASQYKDRFKDTMSLLATLDHLIIAERNDPQFSFYVDAEFPGNYRIGPIRKKTDLSTKEYSFAEIMYLPYFRPLESAKYKFIVSPQP